MEKSISSIWQTHQFDVHGSGREHLHRRLARSSSESSGKDIPRSDSEPWPTTDETSTEAAAMTVESFILIGLMDDRSLRLSSCRLDGN